MTMDMSKHMLKDMDMIMNVDMDMDIVMNMSMDMDGDMGKVMDMDYGYGYGVTMVMGRSGMLFRVRATLLYPLEFKIRIRWLSGTLFWITWVDGMRSGDLCWHAFLTRKCLALSRTREHVAYTHIYIYICIAHIYISMYLLKHASQGPIDLERHEHKITHQPTVIKTFFKKRPQKWNPT